jgi:hypothetical protein
LTPRNNKIITITPILKKLFLPLDLKNPSLDLDEDGDVAEVSTEGDEVEKPNIELGLLDSGDASISIVTPEGILLLLDSII